MIFFRTLPTLPLFVIATVLAVARSEENLHPPLCNVTVDISEHLNYATVIISYEKPRADDFWGVEIWFTVRDNVSLGRKRTRDLPIIVDGLPLFSRLTLHVKALYKNDGDYIGSESIDKVFAIQGGEIPKPEIVTLMAIDGRTALIRWKHAPKDDGEIHYSVSWGPTDHVEVEENENSFAVIQGFEPGRIYNVTVTVHVEFHEHALSNISDPKLLKMPPANALKPNVKVMGFTELGLRLGWDVLLPMDSNECEFLVEVCPLRPRRACSTYGGLPHDERSLLAELHPSEPQNVTVSTICRFFDAEPVVATSEMQTVSAAYHPPPPSGIEETRFSNGTGFRWRIPHGVGITVAQYRVMATRVGQDLIGDPTDDTIELIVTTPSLRYQILRPESHYRVKISSCSGTSEASCGPFSREFDIFTGVGNPSAPEVQLVRADKDKIVIRWLPSEAPAGPIHGYEVALAGPAENPSEPTWNDCPPGSRDMEFKNLDEGTEYSISVRAFNVDRNNIRLRSPASTLSVGTATCGKSVFWVALFAVFGVAAISTVVYVAYVRYRREQPDEPEIVMGEEPPAAEDRSVVSDESSVLP